MDILNEEEAMFESPLVDSYLSSPVTVSIDCSNTTLTDSHSLNKEKPTQDPTGGLFYIAPQLCHLLFSSLFRVVCLC